MQQPDRQLSELSFKMINEFGSLNSVELNRKPEDNSWSIGQCLHHLYIFNSHYLPVLQIVSEGKHKASLWEKYNPLSSYTGRNMIKSIGSVVTKKYKTPLIFTPSKTMVSDTILSDLLEQQKKMIDLFKELEKEKYKSEIVTSPVAPLITLPVQDILYILANHSERHVNQAMKVKHLQAFSLS